MSKVPAFDRLSHLLFFEMSVPLAPRTPYSNGFLSLLSILPRILCHLLLVLQTLITVVPKSGGGGEHVTRNDSRFLEPKIALN